MTWIVPAPWDRRDAAATELLGEPEYSHTGYFGNEGSNAAFYISATLLVTIPPVLARTRASPTRIQRRGGTRK